MKRNYFFPLLMSMVLFVMAGCGGGGGTSSGGGGASATVAVQASATSAAISGSGVTILATVTSGGVAQANQTVTFSVASGTGTLTPTTASTDANGVATTTLTSSAVNAVVVKATVGAVSNTSPTINFVQPTLAVVKVGTGGATLPAGVTIGGIQATLTYPNSVTISAATAGDIAPSGAAGGAGVLFQPNTNNAGQVPFILAAVNNVNGVAVGIQSGEFATFTFHLSGATLPTLADFAIVGTPAPIVVDAANNLAIAGMTVQVLSMTLQ